MPACQHILMYQHINLPKMCYKSQRQKEAQNTKDSDDMWLMTLAKSLKPKLSYLKEDNVSVREEYATRRRMHKTVHNRARCLYETSGNPNAVCQQRQLQVQARDKDGNYPPVAK